MQGPLNTAGLIWEQQRFLMAMHTDPKAVHKLMVMVTDFIVEVFHALQCEFGAQLIHPNYPNIWIPTGLGVGITEDLLPLLSARSYREFGLPYSQRIAETFGGLFIHCCGPFEHHLETLAEIPNLRGLDFHYSYTRPEAVQEVLGDGTRAFVMNLGPKGAEQFPGKLDFLKFGRKHWERGMRLIFRISASRDAPHCSISNWQSYPGSRQHSETVMGGERFYPHLHHLARKTGMERTAFERLNAATLALLERTGVRVESEAVRSCCAQHGVRVDTATHRDLPFCPASRASTGPHTAYLHCVRPRGQTPPHVWGRQYLCDVGWGSLRVLTLDGHYEPSTWEHLRQFNVLLDALPNVAMCINQVDPLDDPGANFYRRVAAEMLTGVTSRVSCKRTMRRHSAFAEMGTAIRGSRQAFEARPVFVVGGNSEPPLSISKGVAELTVPHVRPGYQPAWATSIMLGITSPVTVAGGAVQLNAVQLAAIVISQAARPGAPFFYTLSQATATCAPWSRSRLTRPHCSSCGVQPGWGASTACQSTVCP